MNIGLNFQAKNGKFAPSAIGLLSQKANVGTFAV